MTRTTAVRLPAVLAAAALAVLGAAAPAAAAASDGPACVVAVENPDRTTCFATFREALDFASGGEVRYGPKNAGDALRDPAFRAAVDAANTKADRQVRAGALSSGTVISIEYENTGHGGSHLIYTGSSGNCSTSTGNVDYQVSSMPSGWNNRLSSFLSFANCWVQHWESTGHNGASVGPTGSRTSLGLLDNHTSSIIWT
jgi:hypothetical protein